MPYRISIRNLRRIERADISVEPGTMTLIGGMNGVGKSTLATAIARTLAGVVMPSHVNKGDAEQMVRRGAKEGYITIAAPDGPNGGQVTVTFPAAQQQVTGRAPWASRLATGLINLPWLPIDKRTPHLADLLEAVPTWEDLDQVLRDDGVSKERRWEYVEFVGGKPADKPAEEKTGRGATKPRGSAPRTGIGFGAASESAGRAATDAKGQWKQVTGEAWGDKKALSWKPEGYGPAHDLIIDQHRGENDEETLAKLRAGMDTSIASLRERHAAALRAGGAKGNQLEMLEGQVALKAAAEAAIKGAEATRLEQVAKAVGARKRITELPAAGNPTTLCACPSCGEKLVVVQPDQLGAAFKLEVSTFQDAEEMETAATTIRELHQEAISADAEAAAQHRSIAANQMIVKRADEAAALIEEMKTKVDEKSDDPEALQASITSFAQDFTLCSKYLKARVLNASWRDYDRIAFHLSDNGVRRTKLLKMLDGKLNNVMSELCDAAGWAPVRFDPDLQVRYGIDLWEDCAESEQWRIQVVIRTAVAMIDGSEIIVADAADVLDRDNKGGLLAMLMESGKPAIITMTTPLDAEGALPDLAQLEVGQTFWLDDGILYPLEEALERLKQKGAEEAAA